MKRAAGGAAELVEYPNVLGECTKPAVEYRAIVLPANGQERSNCPNPDRNAQAATATSVLAALGAAVEALRLTGWQVANRVGKSRSLLAISASVRAARQACSVA
jgi:hypothetical protein